MTTARTASGSDALIDSSEFMCGFCFWMTGVDEARRRMGIDRQRPHPGEYQVRNRGCHATRIPDLIGYVRFPGTFVPIPGL
ncbi:MAG: hypothetical protein AVDCRST_MAG87-1487 [uncultured Thermomicrobiales bacterium]|uniref:Uncharacterized protein n=1 Tax=uncultured Thermomicrobiales bacterium TaxID=1645740 RepID=A0A6J4UUY0_9BACT|nr:MAG: hypothetical protein AVDCRST_MAG87-1487 [uncultured Thermomicrobiales bacterium]